MFFYQFGYMLLFAIVITIFSMVCATAFVLVTGDYGMSLTKFWSYISNIPGEDALPFVIWFMLPFLTLYIPLLLVSTYYAIKLSFKKMFFKPYKKFVVVAKIEKISPKMVFAYWGISILLYMPAYLVNFMLPEYLKPEAGKTGVLLVWLIICGIYTLYTLCLNLILCRKFVHKYAIVLQKAPQIKLE